jgi:AcrR family transcriptional regulator
MTPAQARMSGDDRRDQVLDAALAEFALGGLAGTSTEAIAARAGISQPYLFKMFGTKRDLFLGATGRCFENVIEVFDTAAEGLAGQPALMAMGDAYKGLIADRENLLGQLQMYAACGDPEVRTFARHGFRALYQRVEAISGASAQQLAVFFAVGMLCNLSAALGLNEIDEPWAKSLNDPSGFFPQGEDCST